jgi:hypothetical protein
MLGSISSNLNLFSQYITLGSNTKTTPQPDAGTEKMSFKSINTPDASQVCVYDTKDKNINVPIFLAQLMEQQSAQSTHASPKAEYLAANPGPAMYETEFRNLNWHTDESFFNMLGGFGGSVSSGFIKAIEAYYDESSTEDNPVFYVQAFDENKTPTAYKIELNKIDPSNATRAEMILLTSYMLKDAEPETASLLSAGMENDFLAAAYESGVSAVYANYEQTTTYSEAIHQKIDYGSIMGKLADEYLNSPYEVFRCEAKQLKALFASIDSGDWSKLEELSKEVSVSTEEWNAMMVRDEVLWSASGGTKEQDDASLANSFKNRYSGAMDDGRLSSNILQSSWDDFFAAREKRDDKETLINSLKRHFAV